MSRRKKILVVEDSPLNRDLMIQLLEEDYDLLVAADGGEGVRKAEQDRPDLVLMDLALPVLDGWEATRRIKANRELQHIPIIAVTSHAMLGEADRAREAGCDDYVSKPIDERLLKEKIASLIARRSPQGEA